MKKKTKDGYKRLQQDDGLQTYFNQIKAFPLLDFEEELELSKRIQEGDSIALHKLINANLRLVIKIARQYITPDISFLDLIQEGNMGLMHAAEKYDYGKNVRFCTYAGWWIRQFVSRYITNRRRIVRLPHRKEEILRKIQHTYHALSQSLMHQPKTEDIADELGISVHDVDYIVNMSSGPLPLGMETLDDENAPALELHEDYTYSPERTLQREVSRDSTMLFLNKLKDREKKVLIYRFQLNGGQHYTLKEIGDKLDISPETVRQIEIRALQKIRSQAEELKSYVFLEAM